MSSKIATLTELAVAEVTSMPFKQKTKRIMNEYLENAEFHYLRTLTV